MSKQTCSTCRWVAVCIDPCDNCPKMDAVKFDSNGEPIQSTLCNEEQGSKECYNIVCPSCEVYERKLAGIDIEVARIKKQLS